MSSLHNMLGLRDDGEFNMLIVIPAAVVLVAVVMLLKLSVRNSESNRKSQNVKKNHKNKQKDVKQINDKKGQINKELKPALILANTLNSSDDTLKPKTNKSQFMGDENLLKNNVQAKKLQVNNTNKNPTAKTQSNKKQFEVLISNNEEGEWQMVTSKKQKQTKQDEPTETTKSINKLQNSPKKSNKVVKKTKKVEAVNENNCVSAQSVNGETILTPLSLIQDIGTELSQCLEKDVSIFTGLTPLEQEISVSESYVNNIISSIKDPTSTPAPNLATDKPEDDGWTDTKPQKKNRRKALRE